VITHIYRREGSPKGLISQRWRIGRRDYSWHIINSNNQNSGNEKNYTKCPAKSSLAEELF
jgi:hypothetical protein